MNRAEYRAKLVELPRPDWDAYLLAESGLPGSRANLSLAEAAADAGDEAQFHTWLTTAYDDSAANDYLPLCAAIGYGRLLVEGHTNVLDILRKIASDSRWRLREGVCLGLQRWGEVDMSALITAMTPWADGNLLEQRAAAAALCEPRLLKNPDEVARILNLLDLITVHIAAVTDRKSEDFKVLRKGMAYCWSIAVAANPSAGKPLMKKWLASADKDIIWIMRENLKKDRLKRMDSAWVERWNT